MTAHRRPPMLSQRPGKGLCQWCGAKITSGRPDRGWHDGRNDEPDCIGAYKIATTSAAMRWAVEKRDHGICAKCGCDANAPSRFHKVAEGVIWDRNPEKRGRYTEIAAVSGWVADHIIPLWMVPRWTEEETRDLARLAELRRFWSLSNLQTLCVPCNKIKTAADQADIAKVKRLRGETGKGPKRKIAGRGFDKTKRRKLDGSTVERTGAARMT